MALVNSVDTDETPHDAAITFVECDVTVTDDVKNALLQLYNLSRLHSGEFKVHVSDAIKNRKTQPDVVTGDLVACSVGAMVPTSRLRHLSKQVLD
ncbi:hypothetical protein DPMN_070889 [Dreissena polymorpha]|uniref:Uncharacterized protein n=1 Tax=Dreissena polymorpha TaxID=45954 RepID=A0A9D4BW00_DREPO|nr:hypothetical protein DPMN_070889 [Dreissena polymorpha]